MIDPQAIRMDADSLQSFADALASALANPYGDVLISDGARTELVIRLRSSARNMRELLNAWID